jgi:hypothetical protein
MNHSVKMDPFENHLWLRISSYPQQNGPTAVGELQAVIMTMIFGKAPPLDAAS